MPNQLRFVAVAYMIGASAVVACGGDDDVASGSRVDSEESVSASAAGAVSDSPQPAEMCEEGQHPAVAAYALEDGGFLWAACSSNGGRRSVIAATDEAVYVTGVLPGQEVHAYGAADGKELPEADPPAASSEPEVNHGNVASFVVDGVRIEGGQDDPTNAFDADTGEKLWTRPGKPAYDDVWAVGDGAVYLVERGTGPEDGWILAYELESGNVRWKREQRDAHGVELGWPWHVDGSRLFTIWSDLAVLSTEDGSTQWRTDYRTVSFPRMTGVRANEDAVFVAFSSEASPGD